MSRARHILTIVVIVAMAVPAAAARRRRRRPQPPVRRDPPPAPLKLTPEQRKQVAVVVGGGNEFAMDLYAQLAPANKGNLFFSPMSIHTALAMTQAGARGTTAQQMSQTLHLAAGADTHPSLALLTKKLNSPPRDFKQNPLYELSVVNALWGDKRYDFEPEFTALLKEHYGAGMRIVDFGLSEPVRKTINDWAARQTRQKILDLIPQGLITPLTRLVLTNAIYFKSNWAHPFKKPATAPGEFRTSAGKTVRAQMMNQQYRFNYYETADFQVLRLPYNRWALSMLIFLPKKDAGLAGVEKKLTTKNLAAWLPKFRTAAVKVTLPRFTFASQFRLSDTLKAMGMGEAFSMGADFSGMSKTKKKDLYISDVVHKAFVALDEKGTEAAAATAVMMKLKGAPRPMTPKVFKADHPFLFLIRHRETGSILFMGRVADPVAK